MEGSPTTEITISADDPIEESNRTDRYFPDQATLHGLIEARAAHIPGQPAVICDHDTFWAPSVLDYQRFNKAANHVAHRLRECGVVRDHIVGAMLERSFAMPTGLLGILKAGGAYLPLSPNDPAERVDYVLRDAGARTLLVHNATAAKAPAGFRVINLEDQSLYEASSGDNPTPAARPNDLAYVIYTSGSTGRPKGVMVEHRSVINRLHWMQQAYPIDGQDVLLQKTAYGFDVSVWELFWGTIEGAPLCMLAPKAERIPQAIVEAVRKHRVTTLHFVPSMLNAFLEYLDGKREIVSAAMHSLRRVFASGEALTPGHVRKFNEIIGKPTGARLINLYGPTEATVDVTYFDCPTDGEPDKIPIGKPIQNTRAYIVRGGEQTPIGEPGELCIAGVGLARGYVNNPQLTRDVFIDNPLRPGERIYRTGDLARWLPDGNIEYLGREDHQVKIRGMRIELGEIENVILGYAGIADCAVVTRAFSETVVLIVAYLVCKQEIELTELRRALQNQLPEHMIPNRYETIGAIPLTANGKVDRKALAEAASPRLAR